MRFEKINEDKIRITFNLEDLKEKNIDYHDFMANSIETQSIFLDMLTQAEKEIGFSTNNYKLVIEALASSDGSFVLTVTRSKDNEAKQIRRVTAKRKTISFKDPLPTLIYKFKNFDEFYELCNYIPSEHFSCLSKTFNKAILYVYNNSFYLLLKTSSKANVAEIKYIISLISEFSTNIIQTSEVFQNKLNEYGEILIKNNCFLKLINKNS